MNAIYIGEEFEDYQGIIVNVENDLSEPFAPCYKIQFPFSNEWIGNMHDEDLDFNM